MRNRPVLFLVATLFLSGCQLIARFDESLLSDVASERSTSDATADASTDVSTDSSAEASADGSSGSDASDARTDGLSVDVPADRMTTPPDVQPIDVVSLDDADSGNAPETGPETGAEPAADVATEAGEDATMDVANDAMNAGETGADSSPE